MAENAAGNPLCSDMFTVEYEMVVGSTFSGELPIAQLGSAPQQNRNAYSSGMKMQGGSRRRAKRSNRDKMLRMTAIS